VRREKGEGRWKMTEGRRWKGEEWNWLIIGFSLDHNSIKSFPDEKSIVIAG
jgi:hypothetical protein